MNAFDIPAVGGRSLSRKGVLKGLVRESFFDFVKTFWSVVVQEDFVSNWHMEYICGELQEMAERVLSKKPKQHDLIINIPPGMSKSTIVSQMFPAWVWTRMPSAKFICVSYSHQVAIRDSLHTRDIVTSDLFRSMFVFDLREDENTKGLFKNLNGGWRLSAGIDGTMTGFHGHFIIVDDPINPKEAASDVELKRAFRAMESTLPSRKVNKEIVPTILIQQRLHQADPTGELLRRDAGRGMIKHICLPGILTDKVSPVELREKYVDGLLDPKRMSHAVVRQMKEVEYGAYDFASQILQDPVPMDGALFDVDKIQIISDMPEKIIRRVRSWDKAGTQDGGAYTVGVLMGVDFKGRYYILDVVRGQWASAVRESIIRNTALLDGLDVEILIEIEGGSGGKESGESTVRNLAGFRVVTFHPTGDKEARAYALSSQVGSGNVLVLDRHWTKEFIEELRYFPKSRYKDQVDASSSAFNRIARRALRIGGMKALR